MSYGHNTVQRADAVRSRREAPPTIRSSESSDVHTFVLEEQNFCLKHQLLYGTYQLLISLLTNRDTMQWMEHAHVHQSRGLTFQAKLHAASDQP